MTISRQRLRVYVFALPVVAALIDGWVIREKDSLLQKGWKCIAASVLPSIFVPPFRVCMTATPRALPSGALLRHVHTTSSWKGAASKLKEVPMDVSDDIDPTKPADYNPSSFDLTESRSAPSRKILQIVDEIANLTLLEASDLSYLLKKKLGLPDSAMPYYGGGMAATQAGAVSPTAEEEKKPEKTNFDVKLEKYDAAAKIKVIKEVRTFTALGLKEAKEIVEKLPAILKKGVGKEEAEQMIEKLKAVGATAVLE